jgi:hypothetical protein
MNYTFKNKLIIKGDIIMSCRICEGAKNSFSGKPFSPPNGSIYSKLFKCDCGEMWWQYNRDFNLWATVADEATYLNILNGCPQPVAVGFPSKNLF